MLGAADNTYVPSVICIRKILDHQKKQVRWELNCFPSMNRADRPAPENLDKDKRISKYGLKRIACKKRDFQ